MKTTPPLLGVRVPLPPPAPRKARQVGRYTAEAGMEATETPPKIQAATKEQITAPYASSMPRAHRWTLIHKNINIFSEMRL